MYSVSTEFRNQLRRHTRVEHVRGTIGGVSFDDSNVLAMSYSNRCSNTDDVSLGLAYIGQLQANFVDVPIARKRWKTGTKIVIEWGVELIEDDEIVTEWVPVGVFYIASAEHTDSGVQVTANDVISKLDKSFGQVQTNANTIGGLASFACEQCGVEFALTAAQTRALPNGTKLFKLYKDNDVKTWRDYIAWLATLTGGFVTATRDGKVTIVSFADSETVDTWGTGVRIAGSVFSDYDNEYAGISFVLVNMKVELSMPGDAPISTDNYINIGADPFITDLDVAKNIANVANGIAWTPFETSLLSNLVYDLGDLVECQNGIAGGEPLTCCIMSIDWTFKELTKFQGYGAEPSLSAGKSQTDKALNGVKNSVEGERVQFTKFVNSTQYTLTDEEQTIAELRFALTSTNDVETWDEIKFLASSSAKLTLFYYLDGELVEVYNPVDTWTGGGVRLWVEGTTLCFSHVSSSGMVEKTENYHYHLNDVPGGTQHTWRITAKAEPSGSVIIDVGDEHVVLWAPGMVGEDQWNGFISAEDEIPFLLFDPLEIFGTLTDSATVTAIDPGGDYDLTTETGDNITTESGALITTGNIEDLPDADPLDGSEYIPIIQDDATVKTTAQDIADIE